LSHIATRTKKWTTHTPTDTTGRPAQVGLAHELVHGADGIAGNAINTNSKDPAKRLIVRDPDDNNARKYMHLDEINVRKNIDNAIRKEQGFKQRAIPKITE
jgi:hypothetical protein